MGYYYVVQIKRPGTDWQTSNVVPTKELATSYVRDVRQKQKANPSGHPYGEDVRLVVRRK